jgi:hypothetical protein
MAVCPSEPKLRAVFGKLKSKFDTLFVFLDQPANIGAVPPTVARDCGCEVAYLPGLAMRQVAEMHEGITDRSNAAPQA